MRRKITMQLLLMVFPLALFAQTGNGKKSSFKDHLKAKEKNRKTAIKDYAKKNKIPVTGTGEDGAYMYLHHIDNNKPVYYTTRGDNNTASSEFPSFYLRMDNGEWRPSGSNISLEKGNSTYLSIKSNEPILNVWVLDSNGRIIYRSKKLNAKMLMIPTKRMEQKEYVISLKTKKGLSTQKVIIN